MNLKELGIKIAQHRVAKNLSAYELSLRIGKSHGYIHMVESGQLNISTKMLFAICEVLEIEPVELLS